MSAIDTAAGIYTALQNTDFPSASVQSHMRSEVMLGSIDRHESTGNERLVRFLRSKGSSGDIQQSLLVWYLQQVRAHRATNPCDKIFALESLVFKSAGRLINVNYDEPTEAVFRRITARFFNMIVPFGGLEYDLLIESHHSQGENPPYPSWVYDFAHSRAGRENSSVEMTYNEFLYRLENLHPLFGPFVEKATSFASPKTLFCSGVSASPIQDTFLVQDMTWYSVEDVR
ncbi:hypothetical protein GGR58DRAFT_522408 [Xylaria digitata]|nr:hypothetical protein GGR58DRAFT_522408 [Xylaria digitata]